MVAVCIALTYFAPRCQRQRDVLSQDHSDGFAADNELGHALAQFLRWWPPEPRTLERIHLLTGPVALPDSARQPAQDVGCTADQRHSARDGS